jgi:hypothetical protein
MILLTNGDSWTQGDSPSQTFNWEATKTLDWYDIVPHFGSTINECDRRITYKFYDSDVWPKVLGRSLKMETWNAGRLGSCNSSITERTINSISELINKGHTDIFCIIGWTSTTRISIYESIDGKISKEQHRPCSNVAGVDRYFFENKEIYELESIHNILHLQSFLKSNNIKYLFFNAFDEFESIDEYNLSKLIDSTHWFGGDMKKAHFKDYIVDRHKLAGWNEEPYFLEMHPTDISHIEWAEYLHKYIIDNNII